MISQKPRRQDGRRDKAWVYNWGPADKFKFSAISWLYELGEGTPFLGSVSSYEKAVAVPVLVHFRREPEEVE